MEFDNLPPNSHKYNEEKELEKRVPQVVTSEVKTRPRSLGRKFSDIFFDQDVGDIKSYLFIEVFVPAIKNLIMDIVNQGLGMKFYGNSRGYYSKPSNNQTQKTPYGTFYRGGNGPQQPQNRPKPDYNRVSNTFDDIILETKGEAIQVIDVLQEAINTYGQVTVADLYDAVGRSSSNFTDNSFGWFDLRTARPIRVRDGYLLDLPRPVSLK